MTIKPYELVMKELREAVQDYVDSTKADHQINRRVLSAKIAKDVEAYLAKGGKITHCEYEATTYVETGQTKKSNTPGNWRKLGKMATHPGSRH